VTAPDRVRVAAHAKINLFLRVLAREQSGYHSIETLFALLDLADELVVERTSAGASLTVSGADTGPEADNLAVRAANAVLDATGRRFGVKITLTKHIPVQAGLGGGSADAAAALHAVNRLAADAIPRHELLQMAAKIGSDVPFLASGAPLALAWGRGERLFRLTPPAAAPVLIAVPPFGVSTKAAYDLLDHGRLEDSPRGSVVLEPDAFRTWGGIGRLGGNDFEVPVFSREPGLRDLFERMAGTRPLLARMTGSGSAVVALYKNETERDTAAQTLGEGKQRLIRTKTLAEPAAGPLLS
jgi:4-diphosphocytidyl-2-C-methyl-D-erythritol kinase